MFGGYQLYEFGFVPLLKPSLHGDQGGLFLALKVDGDGAVLDPGQFALKSLAPVSIGSSSFPGESSCDCSSGCFASSGASSQGFVRSEKYIQAASRYKMNGRVVAPSSATALIRYVGRAQLSAAARSGIPR